MKYTLPKIGIFLLSLLPIMLSAQETLKQPEMADLMRSNGKIYVVVAVIMLIFLGIVFYLFRLERKMDKMEKENNLS